MNATKSFVKFFVGGMIGLSALASSAFAEDSAQRLLTVVSSSIGIVFADANDRTIYTFDKDVAGVSTCYNQCAIAWPPVLVPAKTPVAAPLSLSSRQDGSSQLSYNGKPLYFYKSDSEIGDTNGDNVGGIWHVINLH